MKIGQKFNTLTLKEYFFYIANHKRCSDFNTLGLYRSILENEKLSLAEKVEVRDYANQFFQKTFNFLQVKDPETFLRLSTLGEDLSKEAENNLRNEIRKSQRRILKAKKIRHRSFGVHSRHTCVETCVWNGLMVRPGSKLSLMNGGINFDSDKNDWCAEIKSLRVKIEKRRERSKAKQIIRKLVETE